MQRVLDELRDLQETHGGCPIVMAGDVFHYWNEPAELINFALKYLPDNVYAVPGQHDLPHHNLKDIEKSAYGTLVRTRKTSNLEVGVPCYLPNSNLVLYGFPWGSKITRAPLTVHRDTILHVAVVHSYVWAAHCSYPGSRDNQHFPCYQNAMKGFDTIAFGDNHKGFIAENKKPTILNCGSMIRRTADEREYKPRVWLLYSSGKIEPYSLDISKDKVLDLKSIKQSVQSYAPILEALNGLDSHIVPDFLELLRRAVTNHKVPKGVVRVVTEVIEEIKSNDRRKGVC
jgi:DNA repair exonuclease SbcCD nuclease subunit